MQALCDETISRFRARYNKNTEYYVSFSGGKDSMAALEITNEAIPGKYRVVFGDTQMELPTTYEYVDEIEKLCESRGVSFIRAKSELPILESWRTFGPPSRIQRWCCSAHKSTPIALITKKFGKHTEAIVGARRSESLLRRNRPLETNELDSKVIGEKNFNMLVDWTSAEVWAYLFYKNAPINKAYRVGFKRVGCLTCPMQGER